LLRHQTEKEEEVTLVELITTNKHLFTEKEKVLLRFFVWPTIREDFVSVETISKETGLSDRSLRGSKDEDGIRTSTSKKLFTLSGYKIISRTGRPSGLKLTNDPMEWALADRQIEAHLWSEKRGASHLKSPLLPSFWDHPTVSALKREFNIQEIT
jgi:hypothetical protein